MKSKKEQIAALKRLLNTQLPDNVIIDIEHSEFVRSCPVNVASNDGTITKPFLIEGGRYIVEINLEDGLEFTAFSIRGVVNSKRISDVLQSAELFISKTINDSKHSER